jgi:hypothetical protein
LRICEKADQMYGMMGRVRRTRKGSSPSFISCRFVA